MKRSTLQLILLLLCLLAALFPPAARAALPDDVAAILRDKLLARGAVGVEIVKLADTPERDRVVFSHQASGLRIPASNLKLVTTAAALERLGADFKFRTVLMRRDDGDLVFAGDGDPTLGDAELLKKVGWGTTTVFEAWAKQLRSQGVTSVRDVLIDDAVFDDVFVHPNWPADQLHKRYVAGVGGINLNANCVDFTVQAQRGGGPVAFRTDPPDTQFIDVRNTCASGDENKIWLSRQPGGNRIILRGEAPCCGPVPVSVTIHDPPMFAGTVLVETLRRAGVAVTGAARRDPNARAQRRAAAAKDGGAGWSIVGIHETPLSAVLGRANKDSMNVYAESLCKRLGHEATKRPGSWASGTAAMGEYLVSAGVDESEFKLDDGCGLSKQNLISPHAIARVLAREYHGRNRQAFLESLSIAGHDGTLEDRFRTMPDLRGRVLGKSGYVSGVRSLSGYLKAKDGSHYAFAILMNRVSDAGQVKVLQERIVKAVDDHASAVAAGQ